MESMKWQMLRSCGWSSVNCRFERCKNRVGNHGGLQKTKEVKHTTKLVGIGKPGNKEIGTCSLGLLILSHWWVLPISSSKLKLLSWFVDSFSFYSDWWQMTADLTSKFHDNIQV